ncbi:hypothetical protein HGRIS_004768 [Hohenbuehelia grisea]|uniref:Oxo-4-hydroxy-4-carboxy-5-ureidoimidazoline decarboxylase domain-containing protein n=1 Tax=Hohenbuehelia grisea TaxID=104357 RepID=A0ABR3JE56_9AGAR
MSGLPSLASINEGQRAPLVQALAILLEFPETLHDELIPSLITAIQARSATPIASYNELIDVAFEQISNWDQHLRAKFIAGHPRIGESKNLSALSAKEQGSAGAAAPTPPDVLGRLAHLNECYEQRYPGLRYITFVNGRSRAAIALEMEEVLAIEHSLSPTEPPVSSFEPVEVEGDTWVAELTRAVVDVGRIAKSRLKSLGVD